MTHSPRPQSAPFGRFIVCTCAWRSGFGSAGEVRAQFDRHLKVVEAAA